MRDHLDQCFCGHMCTGRVRVGGSGSGARKSGFEAFGVWARLVAHVPLKLPAKACAQVEGTLLCGVPKGARAREGGGLLLVVMRPPSNLSKLAGGGGASVLDANYLPNELLASGPLGEGGVLGRANGGGGIGGARVGASRRVGWGGGVSKWGNTGWWWWAGGAGGGGDLGVLGGRGGTGSPYLPLPSL